MIVCKSPAEIEKMRAASALVAEVLAELAGMVAPGVSTLDLDIEAAGYLGPIWLALLLLSLLRRASRPWALAAAVAFWAALGRGYGLFDLLAALPGISGLRAAGRAQVLVMLFSLPAVLGWLETLRPPRALAPIALALLDLLPASRPERVQVDPALWDRPTALSKELAQSSEPLLVFPEADPRFMLNARLSQRRPRRPRARPLPSAAHRADRRAGALLGSAAAAARPRPLLGRRSGPSPRSQAGDLPPRPAGIR